MYTGRIMEGAQPNDPLQIMHDLQPMNFVCPVVDRWSPVAYSVMVHAHVTLSRHGGVTSTLRAAENIAFILHGKQLAVEVWESCAHCKRYKIRLEKAVMGPVPPERITIAPAFYNVQVDIFGPLDSHCVHGRRAVVKNYGVVFKCCTSLAVAVFVMEGYSTSHFLDAFYRFSCRYGYPAKVFIDAGSQLLAAFRHTEFSMTDLTRQLNEKHGIMIEFEVCPVGSHEANGLVERSIQEIKKLLATVFHGLKMDTLRMETVFSWIANELNSLPICLGSQYRNLEHADLITPNRLIMGKNNKRAVSGLIVDPHPQRIITQIEAVEQAWWTVWVAEKLGSLVARPAKWPAGTPEIQVGDIVVFVRDKNDMIGCTWRLGEISEVETSRDGVCRRVVIKYRAGNETAWRSTRRSVREVGVLVREHELDLPGKLSRAQKAAGIMMCRQARGYGRDGPGELHMGPGDRGVHDEGGEGGGALEV